MGDNNDDDDFQVDHSDDEGQKNKKDICSSCKKEFEPTAGKVQDFLCVGMCDSCSETFKGNLKRMEDSNGNMEIQENTLTNEIFRDDDDGNLAADEGNQKDGSHEGGDGDPLHVDDENPIVDSSSSKDFIPEGGVTNDSTNSKSKESTASVSNEDMTFDVMIDSVFSCGAKSGLVTIHKIDYPFSACPKHISGRGGGTTLIVTEFSKSIPDLFGYYYYGGMYTRNYSCIAFTMTECGNLFMGVMETMCYKCRIDPVIYFAESDTCRIINERSWRKQFKLNCILNLTIDIDKAKRYVVI